ncbi:MAG: SAP domain-containing protein [Syntrophales bacterium]
MKIQEIRGLAKAWNVHTRLVRSKMDIVRDIQVAEGYSPCFRTKDMCSEDCLWKDDCINLR